jgi:disulfide bond formation protein DsbB
MEYDVAMIKQYFHSMFANHRCAIAFLAAISASALIVALISQYIYGLQPCVLCVYQRIPYAMIVGLGVLYLAFSTKYPKAGPWVLGGMSLLFFIEAVIAFYHTGVERKWWASFLEGCSVPNLEGNITDVLARIAATPVFRCDEIPWTDPVIGLSMANYNVGIALVLCGLALYSWKNAR